jgi:hypothetical protein
MLENERSAIPNFPEGEGERTLHYILIYKKCYAYKNISLFQETLF